MKLKGDSRSRSQQISFGLYFVMHDKSTFRIEICVSNFMSTNMQVQGTTCVHRYEPILNAELGITVRIYHNLFGKDLFFR